MKTSSCLLAAFLAASIVASPVSAETSTQDAVIVTATRTAQTADEALASVSVITRENIERSQATSLSELLTGLTGVDSTVSGGHGKATSLFLRGTNSNHVLVMIDGVKIGSATSGTVSWEFLPLDQIDRIEIVRGPRSSLYGSEAIGGVIQIFTRHGMDKPAAHAEAGTGSNSTHTVSAGLSSAKDGTDLSIAAARFKTGGFNAQNPASVNEPDKDGYSNDSVTARLRHRFGGGAEIDTHLFHAQGHTEFDGSYQNQTDFVQQAVGADLGFSPLDNWRIKLRAGLSQDNTDNFKDRTFSTQFDTRRDTVSWQNDVTLGKHQLLTLGVDREEDRIISTTAYTSDRRKDKGVFGQLQSRHGDDDFLVALRRDDNDTFGKYNTGNAAWGHAFSAALRSTVSYGTAFKAPSFNDLYWPGAGNPNLRPEKSESLEAGLQGRQAWGNWDVRAYQTDADNLIALLCNASYTTCLPQNLNSARIRGLETEINTILAGWNTALNLTLLDPRDLQNDKVLPRRARRSLRLDADRGFGNWGLGASLIAFDERFEYEYNFVTNTITGTNRVGGYGLVNLRAKYDLSRDWQLRARLDNALDKQYETVRNYNSPERGLFMSLNYQMR